MLANTKSKYEHKKVIFGYLSKLKRSSVLLGTVPSNPKVTGDRSPVSPVVVTRLIIPSENGVLAAEGGRVPSEGVKLHLEGGVMPAVQRAAFNLLMVI